MKMIYCLDDEIGTREEAWVGAVRFLRIFIGCNYSVNRLLPMMKKARVSFRHLLVAMLLYKKLVEKGVPQDRSRALHDATFPTCIRKKTPDIFAGNSLLLLIVMLVISSKVIDDTVYTNVCWAEMCSLPCSEISAGERLVLCVLDWEAIPTYEEFISTARVFERVNENIVLLEISERGFLKQELCRIFFRMLRCLGVQ